MLVENSAEFQLDLQIEFPEPNRVLVRKGTVLHGGRPLILEDDESFEVEPQPREQYLSAYLVQDPETKKVRVLQNVWDGQDSPYSFARSKLKLLFLLLSAQIPANSSTISSVNIYKLTGG